MEIYTGSGVSDVKITGIKGFKNAVVSDEDPSKFDQNSSFCSEAYIFLLDSGNESVSDSSLVSLSTITQEAFGGGSYSFDDYTEQLNGYNCGDINSCLGATGGYGYAFTVNVSMEDENLVKFAMVCVGQDNEVFQVKCLWTSSGGDKILST